MSRPPALPRLCPPFGSPRRQLLFGGLLLLATVLSAGSASAALPCPASAVSSHAAINGTSPSQTIDGLTTTGLRTAFDNWQHLEVRFTCEIEITRLRRHMSKTNVANRGAQGEQFLYSQDGVTWFNLTPANTTGWQIYNPYSATAWHSVPYGWSAWLRPNTPPRARFVRFRWDGNVDNVNEVEFDARPVFVAQNVKLTQNGLVTRALPPLPIVAGKTTLLVGQVASLTGGPSRADSARLEVFREDTGALVGTVTGFAFAADNRSLLPAIPTGSDVHYFVPGSLLTAEVAYRFESVLTANTRTHRQVLLSGITADENQGVSIVFVDHDLGVITGLGELVRFAEVMDHTARIFPVKDSHGSLLPSFAASAGADGVRYEYVSRLPLPAQGSLNDPRREFVLSNLLEGDACAANAVGRQRTAPYFAYNFTVVEDLNRNGVFGASEVAMCAPPPPNSSNLVNDRIQNFINRLNQDQATQRSVVAADWGTELANYTLQLAAGGPERQNHTDWLGQAGPRQGWATVSMHPDVPYPAVPHEWLHELGINHSPTLNLPGPAYDLTRLRKVPDPFDVMAGGFLQNTQTIFNSFLSDRDFDAARAQIPASSSTERPRVQSATILASGVLTGTHKIEELDVRQIGAQLEHETLRRDLELALLDDSGRVLVTGPAQLFPPGDEFDRPAGLPPGEDWPWRGEIPWEEYKDLARWLIVRDELQELLREDLVQLQPTVNLLTWSFSGDPVTVTWDGNHPFGHTLRYDVTLTYADGRLVTLAHNTSAESLTLPAWQVPGGSDGTLRVVARAGIRQDDDVRTGINIANRTPSAAVTSPSPGETFAAGSLVTFQALALDAEEGALYGTALTWTSNRSGLLGTGSRLTVPLSSGTHTVTLEAKDSAGALATASVTITVL